MKAAIPSDVKELIKAVSNYSGRLAETIADSTKAVQQWLPANECMVQLFPLSQEAVTIGSDRWTATQAAWNSMDEANRSYQHGFDQENRIRVVRYDTQVRNIYFYFADWIDELVLCGESLRAIQRHRLSDRRITSSSFLSWPELSLSRNDFQYDGDYLLEQRTRYSDINQAKGTVSHNDLELVYSFRWDDAKPQRNLVDVTSNSGECLYVGYRHRKLLHRPQPVLIAFSLDVDDLGDESDADGLAGQCYSLEMTADFAWKFDRVLFCLPEAIARITQGSDVCQTGLEAGGINVQLSEELTSIAEQGGTWAWIDAGHEQCDALLQAALTHGIKVLLHVDDTTLAHPDMAARCAMGSVAAVVYKVEAPESSRVQETVRLIRQVMRSSLNSVRVLVGFDGKCELDLIDFLGATDADGVYVDRVELSRIIQALNQVGLHTDPSVPLTVDHRHVLHASSTDTDTHTVTEG